MKKSVLALFLSVSLGLAPVVHAENFYDVSVSSHDIIFQPDQPILQQEVQIYVTVRNQGTRSVEGTVIFSIDGHRLGVKPFSVRANGTPEDVWIRWVPDTLGSHSVRADVTNAGDAPDANPDDNSVTESVFVDLDTDGDGIPNRLDKDQDNDGLTNEQEQAQSTNQLKSDTDGDGVNDKQDFYPLDPTKTKFIPPPPPVVAKPVSKPVVTPSPKPIVVPSVPASVSVPTVIEQVTIPLATSTDPIEVASTTVAIESPTLEVTNPPTSTSDTPSLPVTSPYRFLWGIAGATGGAALGFVALDWWNNRRRLDD